MQKLTASVKRGKSNQEQIITLHAMRSFQDASGLMIHLIEGGNYVYRDGTPVKSEKDLAFIGDPIQKEMAISWFRRYGKNLAEKYYAAQEKALRRKLGDHQDKQAASDTALDQVLYYRYPAAGEPLRQDEVAPISWMQAFKKRPDWWGMADSIRFNDWVYQRVKHDEKETDGQQDPPKTTDGNPPAGGVQDPPVTITDPGTGTTGPEYQKDPVGSPQKDPGDKTGGGSDPFEE